MFNFLGEHFIASLFLIAFTAFSGVMFIASARSSACFYKCASLNSRAAALAFFYSVQASLNLNLHTANLIGDSSITFELLNWLHWAVKVRQCWDFWPPVYDSFSNLFQFWWPQIILYRSFWTFHLTCKHYLYHLFVKIEKFMFVCFSEVVRVCFIIQ